MQSSIALLFALAAAAAAQVDLNAAAPVVPVRQETSKPSQTMQPLNPECKLMLETMPTPPPEVKAEVKAQFQGQRGKNICEFSAPASVMEQVASYTSAVSVWGNENKDKINSVCPNASKFLAFTACDQQAATEPTAAVEAASAASPVANKAAAATGMDMDMSSDKATMNDANRQRGIAVAAVAVVAAAGLAIGL
ncbi:hypothetical protein G6O67_004184 [Ophiocordyceps sinensis]|uniref:Infection structure specific protein n=2 Tax=Ophiocordyceps sinensis TaxID=72228 RepID=A0A8H4PPF1_9HYPO|nr:hypothetical protein OCS_01722 [Ophiocordyceps sinensis CO18]KAF4507715.1 hypothetical protein G6O67_004184 [Ophiocordyceps sinensis]